jgi:hypothetical protein
LGRVANIKLIPIFFVNVILEYEHHWMPFIVVIYIIAAVKFNDGNDSAAIRQLSMCGRACNESNKKS